MVIRDHDGIVLGMVAKSVNFCMGADEAEALHYCWVFLLHVIWNVLKPLEVCNDSIRVVNMMNNTN